MSDKDILEDLQSGSGEALSVVYQQHRSEFINWSVARYSIDRQEARDIYQNSILIFYENILTGKLVSLNSTLKTYLFAIGKNKIREYMRETTRMVPPSGGSDAYENTAMEEPGESTDTAQDDRTELFRQCLDELGDPCKAVLVAYYYHRLSMAEIAEQFEYKNESTAKNSKYKCLQRLKKCVFTKMDQKTPHER